MSRRVRDSPLLKKCENACFWCREVRCMILKNTAELEDSKRRKSSHFFGTDIAESAF